MEIIGQECSICLEVVKKEQSIGIIQHCRHSYHDKCIRQWSSNSNSCPTCRKSFHCLETRNLREPDKIQTLVSVKNKLLENDAINNIPREFVNPSAQETEPYREDVSGLCYLCASADHRSCLRDFVSCSFCGSGFHVQCLGIRSDRDDLTWCCVVCDSTVEFAIISGRENSMRGRAPPIIRRGTRSPKMISDGDEFTHPRSSRASSRPGLVIHNYNDELDDDFLYMEDEEEIHVATKPIINGGVILRKEQKINNALTEEEEKSWEMFEQALKDPIASDSEAISNNEHSRKKRRRKVDGLQMNATSDLSANNAATKKKSRISCLIGRMRNGTDTSGTRVPKMFSEKDIKVRNDVKREDVSTVCDTHLVQENSSSDSSRDTLVSHASLSLEHKNKIQRFVRDRLRPMYKPDMSTKESTASRITSEGSYIEINKSISRMIYKHIMDNYNTDGVFSLLETKSEELANIVNQYVNKEFKDKHTNF